MPKNQRSSQPRRPPCTHPCPLLAGEMVPAQPSVWSLEPCVCCGTVLAAAGVCRPGPCPLQLPQHPATGLDLEVPNRPGQVGVHRCSIASQHTVWWFWVTTITTNALVVWGAVRCWLCPTSANSLRGGCWVLLRCRFVLERIFRRPDGTYKHGGVFVDIGAHDGMCRGAWA